MRTIRTTITVLAAIALCVSSSWGQVIYGTVGGTYSQNFNWTANGTGTSETVAWTSNAPSQPFSGAVIWVSGANSTGWYAGSHLQDSTNIRAGNGNDGANAGAQINNFYWTSSDSDRSFGGRPTSTVPMNLALRLTNNTGVTLTQFTLGYRLETTHWRASGNHTTANVSYFVGNPSNWRTDTFTAAPSLNLTSVYGGDPATSNTNVNGNSSGNFTTLSPTTITGLNWANGQDLWIRWNFPTGTNLPNVGLDDVTFSAIPEPSVAGMALLGMALLAWRRRLHRR